MTLDTLNPQQKQAVQTLEGPLLLLAGAGTGKTRVITHRIAFLLQQGIRPEQVLSVTFTNKAAREMRERVARLVSRNDAGRLTIGTFHAFCCGLLRRHIVRLGYTPRFDIADSAYQVGLVRNIMADLGFAGEGCDPSAWLATISRAKAALLRPEDLAAEEGVHAADIATVYARYQEQMQAMNQVDFDDLLMLTHRLWEDHPDLLEQYRERYQYLMIDEYQDTNLVQFHLMSTLARPRCNLCVVGDDDQSIYGWRGANLGNILEFERHFPGATIIRLEQNYRSTGTILEAANALIARNEERREKRLWSDRGSGESIRVIRTNDEKEESRFVCEYIMEQHERAARPWSDCAVLFRANFQSRLLEHAFREQGVPYTLLGVNSFYERKEILDALSLLRILHNPRDDMSLLRVLNVPPRGIGPAGIRKLREAGALLHRPLFSLLRSEPVLDNLSAAAAAALRRFADCVDRHRDGTPPAASLHERIGRYFREIGYLDGLGRMYKPREDALKRRDNVFEFINAIGEFEQRQPGGGLSEFLEMAALENAGDKEENSPQGEGVKLMTVHAAKGLEFPLVIVVGLERGIFPHLRALKERSEAEERRLFYVAMTRARDELVLTYAKKRRRLGKVTHQRPSGFLDEIPEHLLTHATPDEAIAPAPPEVEADYFAQMRAMFAPPDEKSG